MAVFCCFLLPELLLFPPSVPQVFTDSYVFFLVNCSFFSVAHLKSWPCVGLADGGLWCWGDVVGQFHWGAWGLHFMCQLGQAMVPHCLVKHDSRHCCESILYTWLTSTVSWLQRRLPSIIWIGLIPSVECRKSNRLKILREKDCNKGILPQSPPCWPALQISESGLQQLLPEFPARWPAQ